MAYFCGIITKAFALYNSLYPRNALLHSCFAASSSGRGGAKELAAPFGVASERILKERSDAQNAVSRFPLG